MNNRDMYYQNLNQGYSTPGTFIPPSGYNLNANYQSYGPNVIPNQQQQYENEYESRISKLERQVRNLDTRLQKIESADISKETENFYMI